MNTIPRKLGRYAIIREIGRGAMGVVYKAHDPIIEREVAIKAIQITYEVPPEEMGVYLTRFHREAKAAGKLNHPNIVTIFDVDEDKESGTPFIVMEFLEGTTMAEIISSGILLPQEDVTHMIIQLADALHYAHNEGVIHRDIKSSNVLVLPGMKVKIMDFGIARLPSSDLTSSGQFVGTPNYMSPEQLEGKTQVDGRSDLFSLGVVYYMLLTGERPFAGESFNTVAYKIVHMAPVPPRRLNPAVPEIYNNVLDKLLAKNPADRYQTGAELVEDLKKLDAEAEELEEVRDQNAQERTLSNSPSLEEEEATIPEEPAVAAAQAAEKAKGKSRVIPIVAAILLAALAITLGVLYYKSLQSQKVTSVPAAPLSSDPLQAMSKQNSIRIKWDLANNYQQTGKYDRSIGQLQDILKLEPGNQEAKQFLDLVLEKKAQEEKKKQEEEATRVAAQLAQAKKMLQAKKSSEPSFPVETMGPAPLELKTVPVELSFEHSFPSGSLYVYSDDKLIFEGSLSGEAKRVLFVKKYKGKLTASLNLPLGEYNLRVHLVCKEQGVSTLKEIKAVITESGPHALRVRYISNPRQLELKWI